MHVYILIAVCLRLSNEFLLLSSNERALIHRSCFINNIALRTVKEFILLV